ncbi:MAG: O-antigen ligase family protein [Flammeovirgaceae bacterium]|nr:O-antigen ligase family protein [Flammeovirgaceae bacterium]
MFVFNPNNQLMNDSWDRFDLWDAAINASTNPFWGEGTGDYKLVLNQYYTTHQMSHFANESLNSHNQFIQIYFSNGIIGLLAIVILLGSPIYRSFKMGNPLGILIFFPFLIYGMTEVFMGRYQGVVFFAFLSQVFFSFVDSQRLNHYNVQMK